MVSRFSILLFFSLSPFLLHAGGIRDSIFELPKVVVRADRIHSVDIAGMKQTRIDSTVLMQKRQLSLSELLSENSPVFIKSHGRGALATASFRGTSSSHTQLHWNGIPLNDPASGMVDFSLIPAFIIDDLVLLHGNASIADRGGGLGGSIRAANIPDWENRLSMSYAQSLGSFQSFGEYMQAGIGNHRLQYRIRAYHDQSANNYQFINRSIGYFEDGDIIHPTDTNKYADYRQYGFLQEVYYRPAQKHIISIKWWSQHADRGVPRVISYEGPAKSLISRQADTDHRSVADWTYFANNGRLLVRAAYANKQMDYFVTNEATGNHPMPVVFSKSRLESMIGKASYKHSFSESFTVENSIDLRHHRVSGFDTIAGTGYEQQRIEYSYLLAVRKRFFNSLNLNFLLRQDRTDGRYTPVIPFGGIDWQVFGLENLILQGNIARNYKQPDLNDLYWLPGGNPDLQSEEGFSYEAGLKYLHQFEKHSLHGSFNVFYSDITNWIIWLPGSAGYWQPYNIDRVLSEGFEADIRLRGSLGPVQYQAMAAYSLTNAINYGDPDMWGDTSYGKQLVYIPKHSGNLMMQFNYREWWFVYQYNAYSERFTTSSNDISRRDWLYPYYMNDISIGRGFDFGSFNATVELNINNLFDETYHTVLYRPMPGRNYSLVLKVNVFSSKLEAGRKKLDDGIESSEFGVRGSGFGVSPFGRNVVEGTMGGVEI
jgi:outer membrane cobalamin receptor